MEPPEGAELGNWESPGGMIRGSPRLLSIASVGRFFFPESATCRDNLEQAKKVPEGRDSDRCADLGRLHVHAGRLPHPDLPRF